MGVREMRTERLRLTRPTAADSAGVFAILGDPRTVEHNPSDRLEDHGEAAALVARWVSHWEEHGFGYWCVREPGSERIIGYAGVKRMVIHGRPVLNLVYRLVPEVWGRGLATEAAAALVSMVSDEMPVETVVARVRPDNRPSQNVALKAGLRRDATMDCQGEDGLDWVFAGGPSRRAPIMDRMEDQQPPPSAEGEAKVVTLCGSTRFEAEFAEVNQRLTMEGCVVISLGMFALPDPSDDERTAESSDLTRRLGDVHLQKIRMADEIFIVDPGGYLGESTRREIAYAESLGKPVRYLSREHVTRTGDDPEDARRWQSR